MPVERTYTYRVPESLVSRIAIGKRVMVPFGERTITAFVLESNAAISGSSIKDIFSVLDDEPLFSASMIPFFHWIADYYLCPLGEVIKCALPGGLTIRERTFLCLTKAGQTALDQGSLTASQRALLEAAGRQNPKLKGSCKARDPVEEASLIRSLQAKGWLERAKRLTPQTVKARMQKWVTLDADLAETNRLSPARKEIIAYLTQNGPTSMADLKAAIPGAPALVRVMQPAGQVMVTEKRVFRDPFGDPIPRDQPPDLTEEQSVAVDRILFSLGNGFHTFLLAGVTGSGKTEVYLRLAQKAVDQSATVLVLVPEIALLTQIERRFRARFAERVAILHSSLSAGERFDQWQRIAKGQAPICIGARSAIFAPLKNIGLIIVDEEHDPSYKQEEGLRYNARDLSVVRGSLQKATVVLGSATPSIQSYHNAVSGKFTEISLTRRVESRPLPAIRIVDLSKVRGGSSIGRLISPELHKAMQSALSRQEQVLLFLNRRGFANFLVCAKCGEALKCKNCDISLTLHKSVNAHKCHYCGFTQASATACSHCGSQHIKQLGLGTEKIEHAVKRFFPQARIARLDRDTTAQRGAMVKILKELKSGAIDILIGTQMVAKGHDFPNITLVGIICADLTLSFPDFRAGERTFQLLAQVAGRAGRGQAPGLVILQTYNPGHFSIQTAKEQDFKKFYAAEIGFRKALGFPPYQRLIQIRISSQDKEIARAQACALSRCCCDLVKTDTSFSKSVTVLGPIEAPLTKIANRYRWQLLLKGQSTQTLHRFVRALLFEKSGFKKNSRVKLTIDVDPFFMM